MSDAPGHGGEARATLRAGLASWLGRTVLLAGPARIGTSTLLAELAGRGANVLGEELVLIDPASGLATGDAVGAEPVRIDLVAVLRFDRAYDGRPWRALAMPEVAHELIGSTLRASEHPDRTRDAAHAVARSAEGIGGRRGEAVEAAQRLTAHLDA